MAINARTKATVALWGAVEGVRDAKKKETRETYAYDVRIATEGGPATVRYWLRDERDVPGVGEVVAIVVAVDDGAGTSFGGSLDYVRGLDHGDLDLIRTQALGASAKG